MSVGGTAMSNFDLAPEPQRNTAKRCDLMLPSAVAARLDVGSLREPRRHTGPFESDDSVQYMSKEEEDLNIYDLRGSLVGTCSSHGMAASADDHSKSFLRHELAIRAYENSSTLVPSARQPYDNRVRHLLYHLCTYHGTL